MNRKIISSHRRRQDRKFHHRVIKFMKGDGGIYVIFILATVMAGAFALSGGILPQLNPHPSVANLVEIDEESAKQSSKSALQLVDIKSKPTNTPLPTPSLPSCDDGVVMALLVDLSGSMAGRDVAGSSASKLDNLKDALQAFINLLPQQNVVISLYGFATNVGQLVPYGLLTNNKSFLQDQITKLTLNQFGTATWMKKAIDYVAPQLVNAKSAFTNGSSYLVFMSDGVPETADCEINRDDGNYYQGDGTTLCGVTLDTHPQNPVASSLALQQQGVKVFSIALYGERETGIFQDAVQKVMRDTASNPDSTYYIGSPTSAELKQAYQTIVQRICQ